MQNKNHNFKKLINPKEWEFEFQQRNKQSVLMADFVRRSVISEVGAAVKNPNVSHDYISTSLNKGYVKKAHKAVTVRFMQRALFKVDYASYILKHTVREMFALRNFSRMVNRKKKLSRKELVFYWEKFEKLYLRIVAWWFAPWYVSEQDLLTNRMRHALLRHKSKIEPITDFENAFSILTFPIRKAKFQEEQNDFIKLAELYQKSKGRTRQFFIERDTYLKKYAWMKVYPLLALEPLTEEELITRIKQAIREGRTIEFHEVQKHLKANAILAKKILKLLKRDKPLIRLIEQTRELGWALTAGIDAGFEASAGCNTFLKQVARELKISWDELLLHTAGEIYSALLGKPLANVKDRRIGYVCTSMGGEVSMVTGRKGKQLAEWLDETLQSIDPKQRELKGQVASKGIARGKVRIALSPAQRDALCEGEILVCSMTSPEYVPAMKRASAIVTDEGGLLSHAAIMSREFGKPCVIATKVATRFLNDGDLVEVDANKGVVKILTRNK